MLVIMGALKEEIKDLRKYMVLDKTFTWQGCHIYQGSYKSKNVVLVQTGMGKNRVEEVTKFVLNYYPVTALISLGFAGALTERLKIGDIVLCATLRCAEKSETIASQSNRKDLDSYASLISRAIQNVQGTTARFYQGSSVTVAKPVSGLKAKLALGKAFDADVVEMESYWIAQIASARQIPFFAIRTISDTVQDTLPTEFLDSNGVVRWKSAIPFFIIHPGNFIKLFKLCRNVDQARESITIFIDHFIANL
jgi:5'-methylthioadenosine/S-adenosylhomocysteine nucleosidase